VMLCRPFPLLCPVAYSLTCAAASFSLGPVSLLPGKYVFHLKYFSLISRTWRGPADRMDPPSGLITRAGRGNPSRLTPRGHRRLSPENAYRSPRATSPGWPPTQASLGHH